MTRTILAVAAALAAMALLTGWGRQAVPPDGAQQPYTVRAVTELSHGRPLPPLPADLRLAPGDCSSPFGATRYGFGPACARHDHGYALLRYAAAQGHPLGSWARAAIDARFADDVQAGCSDSDLGCRLTADLYVDSVAVNSWRQGYGVPIREGLGTLAAALAGGVATLLLALGALARRGSRWVARRRSRWVAWPVTAPLTGAVLGLAVGLEPTMLPRPLWVQAVIGGVLGAHGYAAGAVVGTIRRRIPALRMPATMPRPAPAGLARLLPVGLALVLAAALGQARTGQLRLAAQTGLPEPSALTAPLGLLAAGLVATGLVLGVRSGSRRLARGVRRLATWTVRPRPVGRRPSAVVAGAGSLLLLAGSTLVAADPAQAAPASPRPTVTAATSADPASWSTAGHEGSSFLTATPTAGQLAAATGHPAIRPLRVYLPDSGLTATQSAQDAVDALDRSGGLDRSVVLVVLPTGSGWVNPAAPAALERLTGGDSATVAVQYAGMPSWLAYLLGGMGVQDSARALFTALDQRLDQRARLNPAAHRPRLLVYGESLGAWGGLTAHPGTEGLPAVADGALWSGVPADIRADAPNGLRQAGPGRRVLALGHRDDPVTVWSPTMLVRPVPGWHQPWIPLVSFWQATGDVITARDVPAGHGHVYDGELAQAWRTVLDSPTR